MHVVDKKTNKVIIKVNKAFFRPAEVEILLSDPDKAKEKLGWKPKIKFNDLVNLMMDFEIKRNNRK